METQLEAILQDAQTRIDTVQSASDLEAFKAQLMGPNGSLTQLTKQIGKLSKQERPQAGKVINIAKGKLHTLLEGCQERLEAQALEASIGAPVADVSLPSSLPHPGTVHPIVQVRNEILNILGSIGFVVTQGPEIDRARYCFDALNTPQDHPARSPSDTYYLPRSTHVQGLKAETGEPIGLRPHTSSVQIRTLLDRKPPIRILSPGRCFRRDTTDATHSANFYQIEGLFVDTHVTVRDLKATLDYLFRNLLGPKAQVRFRPHFFPFTEPSFEVDFKASHLGKGDQEWIEIMGCGMVDPNVFEAVGHTGVTGFAFGLGIERIAMILHGIDDIRHLYTNDLRFLRQF